MVTNWQSVACVSCDKNQLFVRLAGCICFLTEVMGTSNPIHGIRIFEVHIEDTRSSEIWIDFQVDVNIPFFAKNAKYFADNICMFMIGFMRAFLHCSQGFCSNQYWFNLLNLETKKKFGIELVKTEDYWFFKKD